MACKYSVIIPVYNVKDYLPNCLDSLLSCQCVDFELLLVDDGSTDTSGQICDEYSGKDSRVRVFHKPNGGVSSARNLGLENASGEWVMFVDSDDYVSNSFFDVDETTSDIIERPYSYVDESSKVLNRFVPVDKKVVASQEGLFRFFVQNRINVLWNKVIRRTLIGPLRFNTSVKIGEDFLFYLELIKKVRRYEFSSKGEYFYLVRGGSAMASVHGSDRIRILFENMSHIKNLVGRDDYNALQTGILCVSYFPLLTLAKKTMSIEDLSSMKKWIDYMSKGDMKFVPFRIKLQLWLNRLLA